MSEADVEIAKLKARIVELEAAHKLLATENAVLTLKLGECEGDYESMKRYKNVVDCLLDEGTICNEDIEDLGF